MTREKIMGMSAEQFRVHTAEEFGKHHHMSAKEAFRSPEYQAKWNFYMAFERGDIPYSNKLNAQVTDIRKDLGIPKRVQVAKKLISPR